MTQAQENAYHFGVYTGSFNSKKHQIYQIIKIKGAATLDQLKMFDLLVNTDLHPFFVFSSLVVVIFGITIFGVDMILKEITKGTIAIFVLSLLYFFIVFAYIHKII